MEESYIALFALAGLLSASLWESISFMVDAVCEYLQHKTIAGTVRSRRFLRLGFVPRSLLRY